MNKIRLLLCSSCAGPRDHRAEREEVLRALHAEELADRVEIADHACFSACAEPVSLAVQGQGRASYVFAGIDPVTDAKDIAATCRTYLDSEAGWIEDARPCGRLRLCLRARLPAYSPT